MELATVQLAPSQSPPEEGSQRNVAELPRVACKMQTDSAVDNSRCALRGSCQLLERIIIVALQH